jgi:hypothetical protein
MNSRSGLVNLLVAFSPLLIMAPIAACAWLESVHVGARVAFAVLVTLLGFGSFAIAKGSQFGAGRWRTLGTVGMAPWARRSYLWGYACMAFGLVGLASAKLFLH